MFLHLISLKLIKSSVLMEGIWRAHYYPEKNVAILYCLLFFPLLVGFEDRSFIKGLF